MNDAERVIICGGDSRLSERAKCPHPLHNWPLPAGYSDAATAATSRLNRGWFNRRCQACGLYGWVRGKRTTADIFVPPPTPSTETGGESEWRCYQCRSTRWGPWGDRAKCHFCGVVSDAPTPTTPSTGTQTESETEHG